MRSPITGTIAALAALAVTASALSAQERVRDVVYEGTFDVSAGALLDAAFDDMDIVIERGSGSSASVRVEMEASSREYGMERFERMRFEASESGGGIRLRSQDDNWNREDWQRGRRAHYTAVVRVPQRFDLRIRTGDGDIAVEDVEGSIDARTADGDIAIGRVAGDEVAIRTSDGDIIAETLEAPEIRLSTSDGDVMVENVRGRLVASTSDGDIDVHLMSDGFGGAELRTGDGDVTVTADPSLAADVDLSGEDLYVSEEFQVHGRMTSGRIRGTLNGGGSMISVRTGDGSIVLGSS